LPSFICTLGSNSTVIIVVVEDGISSLGGVEDAVFSLGDVEEVDPSLGGVGALSLSVLGRKIRSVPNPITGNRDT